MIVYHERTGEPIEVAPCPFADDYPTWMDHEEGEREYQDALPDPSEFDSECTPEGSVVSFG